MTKQATNIPNALANVCRWYSPVLGYWLDTSGAGDNVTYLEKYNDYQGRFTNGDIDAVQLSSAMAVTTASAWEKLLQEIKSQNKNNKLLQEIKDETVQRNQIICWIALRDACAAYETSLSTDTDSDNSAEISDESYIRAERGADACWAFFNPLFAMVPVLAGSSVLYRSGGGWVGCLGLLLITCALTAAYYYLYFEKKSLTENQQVQLTQVRDEAIFAAVIVTACIIGWEIGYTLSLLMLESLKMSLALSGVGWPGLVILGVFTGIGQAVATACCLIVKKDRSVMYEKEFWKAIGADFIAGFGFGVVPVIVSFGLAQLVAKTPMIRVLLNAVVVAIAIFLTTWAANWLMMSKKDEVIPLADGEKLVASINEKLEHREECFKLVESDGGKQAVNHFTFFDDQEKSLAVTVGRSSADLMSSCRLELFTDNPVAISRNPY